MAARDPQTGRFVSSDDAQDFLDMRALCWQYSAEIPAADLSGQTSERTDSADDRLAADFGDVIDDDEVFEIVTVAYSWTFFFAVTSSGEMSARINGRMGPDIGRQSFQNGVRQGSTPRSGGPDDLLDIKNDSARSDRVLTAFAGAADNGESDDTNAVGRGGMEQVGETKVLPVKALYGTGPMADATDEWEVAYIINADQAANVGIEFEVTGVIQGIVHQL